MTATDPKPEIESASPPEEALYSPHLHRYLIRQLRNRDDASDLAQEAYLRYLQLPDTSVVRKPSGYLFRIAFNLISEVAVYAVIARS